jgi:ketosteroid isomerase-like protein
MESGDPSRHNARAMSEENIETVRRFYQAFDRWIASLMSDPADGIEQSAELEEMFDHLDPDAEWDWPLSTDTFKGREQLLKAVAEWFETVSSWRLEIVELIDCGGSRVLTDQRVVARGKGSGVPFVQHIFSVVTVRNGKVARFEDHTEKTSALKAVGLSQ